MKLSDKYDSETYNREDRTLSRIFEPLTDSTHYVGDVPEAWCVFSLIPAKIGFAVRAQWGDTRKEQLRTKRELKEAFAIVRKAYFSWDSTFYEYDNLRYMLESAKEFADKWLSEEARKSLKG